MERERDVLGRAIVDIPTTLGWRIVQSPILVEVVDREVVAWADDHLVLRGEDIRAPIGFERLIISRAGWVSALFLKSRILCTIASQSIRRHLEGQAYWQQFKHFADPRDLVLKLISGYFLAKPE